MAIMTRLLAGLTAGLLCSAAFADPGPFTLGVRANALSAGGEPANDMIGFGIFGKYRLKDDWSVGVSADFYDYDFERPWKVTGVEQSPSVPVIDAPADSVLVSAWLEQNFARTGNVNWFWNAGLGFNSVDVKDVSGPTASGGTFTLTTDPGTEFVLLGAAGFKWNFTEALQMEGALRVQQHFADWTVTDRVSGRVGALDDYTAYGVHLGLGYLF